MRQQPVSRLHVISPNYFPSMGIPLLQGRLFTERDNAEAPGVVMINEEMARRFWPGGDAVGKRITQGLLLTPGEPAEREIVGVELLLAKWCIGALGAGRLRVARQLLVERPTASRHPVSSDYFRAMGIPLRAGRLFTDRDVQGALPVVIIDETLARRHFANEHPIGKHLRFEDASREIVGVVAATRAWKLFTAGDVAAPRVYVPYQQEKPWPTMALIVRAQSGDPMSLIPAIRSELAAIDKDQPIHSFKTLEQSVTEVSADRRFSTLLLTAFAGLAALLAA